MSALPAFRAVSSCTGNNESTRTFTLPLSTFTFHLLWYAWPAPVFLSVSLLTTSPENLLTRSSSQSTNSVESCRSKSAVLVGGIGEEFSWQGHRRISSPNSCYNLENFSFSRLASPKTKDPPDSKEGGGGCSQQCRLSRVSGILNSDFCQGRTFQLCTKIKRNFSPFPKMYKVGKWQVLGFCFLKLTLK